MSSDKAATKASHYRRNEREEADFGPPMDLSFKKATNMDDLAKETARSIRTGKIPLRSSNKRFLTSTLWLNNNSLSSMSNLGNLVNQILDDSSRLAWLDLSFNNLTEIGDEITAFRQLKILYLHGNQLANIGQITKLRKLRVLRNLTLHGNPIEHEHSYRVFVIMALPQLKKLDFSTITPEEKLKAAPPGFFKVISSNITT